MSEATYTQADFDNGMAMSGAMALWIVAEMPGINALGMGVTFALCLWVIRAAKRRVMRWWARRSA